MEVMMVERVECLVARSPRQRRCRAWTIWTVFAKCSTCSQAQTSSSTTYPDLLCSHPFPPPHSILPTRSTFPISRASLEDGRQLSGIPLRRDWKAPGNDLRDYNGTARVRRIWTTFLHLHPPDECHRHTVRGQVLGQDRLEHSGCRTGLWPAERSEC